MNLSGWHLLALDVPHKRLVLGQENPDEPGHFGELHVYNFGPQAQLSVVGPTGFPVNCPVPAGQHTTLDVRFGAVPVAGSVTTLGSV